MRVTADVYALDSTKGNYAYLILADEPILIDTGRPGQGKGILNELKLINIKPDDIRSILITHHDVDHIGNLALLEKEINAGIWASNADIPYICGEKNREGIKRLISIIMRIKKPENIMAYKENQKFGDIEIVSTPGHTPGHVCLLYKDVLFAGDLLRTSREQIGPMASFMNWDTDMSKESIKKIADYNFEWICPAHGEPVKRDERFERLLNQI